MLGVISDKGLINLAMAGPQDIFKQHLIRNEEETSFSKDILHILVQYQLCSFSHELFNPTDLCPPALTLGVLSSHLTNVQLTL